MKGNAVMEQKSWDWTPRDFGVLFAYMLILLILNFLAQQHPFFWDGIQLGAKHGLWYYEQDFKYFFLPNEIDSGHPPFFGIFLALGWTILGKSLVVSHWLMFPFMMGTIYYTFCIGRSTIKPPWAYLFPALLFLDPAFLSQLLLVGPDLILIYFFLMTLWAYLKESDWLKLLGVIGLAMISMRGMMLAFCIYLLELLPLFRSVVKCPRLIFKYSWPYVPGVLLAGLFLFFHYQHTGWIGYHADSPWEESFRRVGLQGFLRNILILGWRLLDFGHIFLFLGIFVLCLQQKWDTLKKQSVFFLLLGLILFVLAWPFLMYQGLSQHRYLLPFFLILSLVFLRMLSLYNGKKWVLLMVVSLGLFSGNRWVYPEKIAQGWDCTLAHWPYYSLQEEVIQFLDATDIPMSEVGAAFPSIGPMRYRYLNGEEAGFKKKDLNADRYIFYSNIMNEYSDEELGELKNWTPLFEEEKRGVRVIIYENAEIESKGAK